MDSATYVMEEYVEHVDVLGGGNMDARIEEIRSIIDEWFTFKSMLSQQDLMPHLVYLLEQYDLLVAQLNKQEP